MKHVNNIHWHKIEELKLTKYSNTCSLNVQIAHKIDARSGRTIYWVDVQLALQFSMTDEKMEKMGGRDSNT